MLTGMANVILNTEILFLFQFSVRSYYFTNWQMFENKLRLAKWVNLFQNKYKFMASMRQLCILSMKYIKYRNLNPTKI